MRARNGDLPSKTETRPGNLHDMYMDGTRRDNHQKNQDGKKGVSREYEIGRVVRIAVSSPCKG